MRQSFHFTPVPCALWSMSLYPHLFKCRRKVSKGREQRHPCIIHNLLNYVCTKRTVRRHADPNRGEIASQLRLMQIERLLSKPFASRVSWITGIFLAWRGRLDGENEDGGKHGDREWYYSSFDIKKLYPRQMSLVGWFSFSSSAVVSKSRLWNLSLILQIWHGFPHLQYVNFFSYAAGGGEICVCGRVACKQQSSAMLSAIQAECVQFQQICHGSRQICGRIKSTSNRYVAG